MVTVAGWTQIEEWWVGSLGSSLTDSDLISGKSGCSNLTVGNKVYGSLWSSSSAEGLGSQSGESRSMGMAWMRSSLGGRGRAKNGCGRVEYNRVKLDDRLTMVGAGLTFSSEL